MMTAVIGLADGRAMIGSNLGVSAMLWLVAEHTHPEPLKRWLYDMSDRPSGFLDFDMGGLDIQNQQAFWEAAVRAFGALAAKHGPHFLERPNAYGANCLERLLEMHRREVAGEPALSMSDFDHVLDGDDEKIDLTALWSDTKHD
jgi:hypothetical protein